MRFSVEARVVDEDSQGAPVVLADFDRTEGGLDPASLGMTLEGGRTVLYVTQLHFARAYVSNWLRRRATCDWCGALYSHKDRRTAICRTVYGRVELPSPRWLECLCKCHLLRRQPRWSPLADALPQRVSPQLEELQVKFAAHLPHAQVVELLKDALSLDGSISVSGTKNRIRAVSNDLDSTVAETIEKLSKPKDPERPSARVTSVAVDSVWWRHCDRTRMHARQLSIACARATLANGTTPLCGYVTKQAPRGSRRVDLLPSKLGVRPDERVTPLSDGAGEFETAIVASQYTGLRIVGRFHIAMKFRAAELTALGMREQMPEHWQAIRRRLDRAKRRLWLVRPKAPSKALRPPILAIPGVIWRTSNTRRWSGSTGAATAACSKPSAACLPRS